MSRPLTGNGATPVSSRPTPNRTNSHRDSGNDEPSPGPRQNGVQTAVAFASPPIGRCHLWVLIVPRCPVCFHAHVHRSTGDHGGRRTGSCGAAYRVIIAGRGRGVW